MGWRTGFQALLLSILLVTGGCAAWQRHSSPVFATTPECEAQFRWWQSHNADLGYRDVQDWSPPGFPFLRLDRLLASYRFGDLSPVARNEWLRLAHEKALDGWRLEAEGQGDDVAARIAGLQDCSRHAILRLVTDKDAWPWLDLSSAVPDSYSTAARLAGFYPLVAPLVRWRASRAMGELMAWYGTGPPDRPWRYYQPAPGRAGAAGERLAWQSNALGIPLLDEDRLTRLFARHAPVYAVATLSVDDVPGRPGRDPGGLLRFRPEPVVFRYLDFTRLQGQVLPQLVYVLWFPARTPQGALDIYAGALDGLVWRVTLDVDGQPLIYDVMHSCGCYHQWMPVQGRLVVKEGVVPNREPFWLPGSLTPSRQPPTLYLRAGDHQLAGLRFGASHEHAVTYRLADYRELRGVSFAGGRLFGVNGRVTGTERPERFLLWPTGVASAGGMRQRGHHAIAFVGRLHFDDPDLLARYFLRVPGAGAKGR